MDTLSLTKEARIYNGEKTIYLTIGAGKTGWFQIGKGVYYPKQSIDSMNSYQATNGIFHRTRTNNFTICMEIQKTSKKPKQS